MISCSHWGLFRHEHLPEDVIFFSAGPGVWLRSEFFVDVGVGVFEASA